MKLLALTCPRSCPWPSWARHPQDGVLLAARIPSMPIPKIWFSVWKAERGTSVDLTRTYMLRIWKVNILLNIIITNAFCIL
ncbi:hypothetical protein LZ554_009057 [Drepanopeziza brunnea f. sp. 'monogermtubi']|nr:hypothetical protein LZ554_009057 [Drepanopeziza brunnea f. sp. 'monogermtubi']